MGSTNNLQIATFGAGCFWGVEHTFRHVSGVVSVKSGFMGGELRSPSYEHVCTGTTGHAEVVQMIYNPDIISYQQLLARFWKTHDPTQVNRQGPDIGRQYRSVIFYHNSEQKELAEKSKAQLQASGQYKIPIATGIEPAAEFYPAEEYHQDYLHKIGRHTCRIT